MDDSEEGAADVCAEVQPFRVRPSKKHRQPQHSLVYYFMERNFCADEGGGRDVRAKQA